MTVYRPIKLILSCFLFIFCWGLYGHFFLGLPWKNKHVISLPNQLQLMQKFLDMSIAATHWRDMGLTKFGTKYNTLIPWSLKNHVSPTVGTYFFSFLAWDHFNSPELIAFLISSIIWRTHLITQIQDFPCMDHTFGRLSSTYFFSLVRDHFISLELIVLFVDVCSLPF